MLKKTFYIGVFVVAALAALLFGPVFTEDVPETAAVIFTQVPARTDVASDFNSDGLPLFDGSRIVRFSYKENGQEPVPLTTDFHSAGSPSLSFDNEQIVFSGKKSGQDPWQIWLMDLDGSHKRKVYDSAGNAVTPAFLPDGRIVFSRELNDPELGRRYVLFTCRPDGSGLTQITYHPHRDLHASALHDGRVAMISSQLYPEKKSADLMVLRPDGTKAQSFYRDQSGFRIKSAVRETPGPEPKLVYVRSDKATDQLVAISYANPVNAPKVIAEGPAGDIHSADILEDSRLVVSIRSAESGVFGLAAISYRDNSKPVTIFHDPDYHSLGPVAARTRAVPKRLPSSLNPESGFGTLLSQNVNRSQIPVDGNTRTRYIRVQGLDGRLGEFEVAEDGSFYLEVQADMPIRFLSLDGNKQVLRGPSSWIWMRSGERRACTGCHSDKAIAPENLVPEAIQGPPVRITDTTRVLDAQVQAIRQEMIKQGVPGNEH
ncbi:MAG: hypothetical protein R3224_03210 [Balneolaceae bacterium]|nr:hypothetical protein [Balneolaceae bacterium]